MTVHVLGHLGNMGSRYRAILDHLGVEWIGTDIRESEGFFPMTCDSRADAIIIATPTDTHAAAIRANLHTGKPILCEKPIVKDLGELRQLMSECVLAGTKLQMVAQYRWLDDPESEGLTVYDYFKTGPDGVPWDLLQPIALARGEVRFDNKSPVWTCQLNGHSLSINAMDGAYIREIEEWLKAPRNDIGFILDSHEKVAKWAAKS